ncbi:hypothetical protein [Pseudotamlana carrageenivorans]|uniref:DUF1129 domain-containing protein n=1 Tax=Pseudotamlana carrageenivorans TaxID=2069432 RepID=A0A2I7SH54_9FLAO|nr:hypothetical protein [Tamlana carrageenivorans]AUS05236.1 hypothetical protein C1A40_07010 [Tamlana carrageenivorans]
MKLTTDEIRQIEKFLDVKGMVYVDLRFEILDHLILQIEEEMNSLGVDFEYAFLQVTKKWNSYFSNSSSLLFGLTFSAPKLVIDKAKKIYLKYFIICTLACLFLPVINNEVEISTFLTCVFFGIILLFSIVSIIMFNKIRKSRKKTVYSFIAKTQLLSVITYPVSTIFIFRGLYTSLWLLFIISILLYCSIVFLKKHQKIIKQFN